MKILKSIWQWIDDRTGMSELIGPIARHLVPPGTSWWYVFGSATLFVFILQVITGIGLASSYVTSTGDAYQSLQFITQQAFLGRFLRGLHYFGASAMVLLIGIHMVRVFLTGSYKFPREMNWLTGAGLLLFTLGMAFTGQLLRWDQNAVWSVVVGAEQAGRVPLVGSALAQFILAGDTVGGATLSRFFSFHVFFIPALIFAFVGFHLYLVLRNGISEPPRAGQPVDPETYRAQYHELLEKHGLPFWPDVAWRDVVFGMVTIFVIAALAIVVGPPALDKPPDPSIIQAYPRPDWYFLWYFAVLALIPAGAEPYVIVLGPVLFGLLLIVLPFVAGRGERSPLRRPWAIGVVMIAVLIISTLGLAGVQAPWSPDFNAQPLSQDVIGAASGPVYDGAQLFYDKGCEYCHSVAGHGGRRGPDLTYVGDRLTSDQMKIRLLTGGTNMPAFAGNLKPAEIDALIVFLQSRTRTITGEANP
jgi:ubiquinol-cytochrome c reductase cytochrome b subunit